LSKNLNKLSTDIPKLKNEVADFKKENISQMDNMALQAKLLSQSVSDLCLFLRSPYFVGSVQQISENI
jgi:hypothetical protein